MFQAVRKLTVKKRKNYCTKIAGEAEDSDGQGSFIDLTRKWTLIV